MASCIVAKLQQPVVLWHQGHEEYIVRDHQSYTPQGLLVPNGSVMRCWLTGKLIGVADLSRDGRRVYAN